MATNTIIQYLESAQTTGLGASVPVGASAMHRSQTETFIAGGTVAVGDWVAFDTSKSGANKVLTVVQASNVALGNALVCGIVLGSADSSGLLTAGHKVKVCISGYVAAAKVNAGVVAAGTPLVVDTTVATAHAAATGDISMCGVSLSASAAGLAEVWVYKQF